MKLQISFNHVLLSFLLLAISCGGPREKKNSDAEGQSDKELTFESRKIVNSAKLWWAHTPKDVTGDGIADLLFIHNNGSGGYLGYFTGKKEPGLWEKTVIAEQPISGGYFASGDLESNDIDGDGDYDVIAVKHPGEWTDAGATAELFWYENTGEEWKAHTIGTVPDAVKDVSFADFDNDGNLDLAVLTFDEHTLSIFRQENENTWYKVQFIQNEVLHEGMDVGDLNSDGFPDIVANGLIYYNPGEDITETWLEENLDEQWNNQEGDWSRNGTKTFVRDTDRDGVAEIYMAHSERAGYPLVSYKKSGQNWQRTVIKDSIVACHTLQVYDFDLDGDFDVLAGVNGGRAVNLDKNSFPVSVFLNTGSPDQYEEMIITSEGIYNGQAIDYDGDGDMDLFRYPDHESADLFLLENKIK
ncbi:FG-GAP repeat domain-containing protein [Poritiphilus flavus]|uniref:VCBS repeat-containing protein n=1 Tax=Poritiphilus flavus TaxID=2697053 RepID=A0A6L9ECE7_9FLAO|nr:VCBS repeat-containing protein [Poritiphilus flavus]NAS12313.1 hypothetical protein [Poritiphilus flavus]